MNKDLISVIVLVYNNEKYIKKCIESIIKQTYMNLEIIVILDGTTDKSKGIVKRLSKKDSRIKIIERENRGTGYSRVEGYNSSSGKFIMFVDGDDEIETNMVELMYKKLKEYNVDVVHSQYKSIKSGILEVPKNILNRNVRMDFENYEPQFFDLLYKTNHCNHIWGQLMKRKVLRNISKVENELIYAEDLLYNIKVYQTMKSILFIPDELYIYNNDSINENNTIEKVSIKLSNVIDVYFELYKAVSEFNIKDKKNYKKLASIKFINNIIVLLNDLSKICNKSQFKTIFEETLNNKKVKEILKNTKKYSINFDLKEYDLKNKIAFNMFINNKRNQLYYFCKYFIKKN